MQADQTVISLRPGGGGGGGNRSRVLVGHSSTNSDLPLLRPHGGGSSSLPSFKVQSFFRSVYFLKF